MNVTEVIYPIGTVGVAWGEPERQQWLAQQHRTRSYVEEVQQPLQRLLQQPELSAVARLVQYGTLDYLELAQGEFKLFAVQSAKWQADKPMVLITGGVHGYETSGVQGALQFIAEHFVHFSEQANLLVLPCISPWGYETINRWNPLAVDPNRSFVANGPSQEANAVFALLDQYQPPLLHIDLHETTDSDNCEFRPAKAARDGTVNKNWNIPDGFYLVGDVDRPEPAFQAAIISAVESVTHIAPADENNCLIGEPLQQKGVINYAKKALSLCGGLTQAPFVTTTEVYPDSAKTSPAECNQAQVAAICAAIEFALAAKG